MSLSENPPSKILLIWDYEEPECYLLDYSPEIVNCHNKYIGTDSENSDVLQLCDYLAEHPEYRVASGDVLILPSLVIVICGQVL